MIFHIDASKNRKILDKTRDTEKPETNFETPIIDQPTPVR